MIESMLGEEEKLEIGFISAIMKVLENYFGKIKVEELYGYEINGIAFDIYKLVIGYIAHGGKK